MYTDENKDSDLNVTNKRQVANISEDPQSGAK